MARVITMSLRHWMTSSLTQSRRRPCDDVRTQGYPIRRARFGISLDLFAERAAPTSKPNAKTTRRPPLAPLITTVPLPL
jgi:hypothetical protein